MAIGKMRSYGVVVLALGSSLLVLPACSRRAAEPQQMTPASRPASAEEERARARQHERMAEQAEERQVETGKKGALERDQLRRTERQHREHAQEHQRLAAELEAFEASECRDVSAPERASCPLMGPIASVTQIDDGVRVTLAESADKAHMLTQMKCHAAFARARGYSGMASCPLYHPGMNITEEPDGRSITLTSSDPTVAAEIRREAELYFSK